MYQYTEEQILKAAIAAHECNRAFCIAIGDNTQVPWEWAEEWQKDASISLVKDIAVNGASTPRSRHNKWCEDKYNAGWKFGIVKDGESKTHPCLVPYEKLPVYQQVKDAIMDCVVNSVLAALCDMEESAPGV